MCTQSYHNQVYTKQQPRQRITECRRMSTTSSKGPVLLKQPPARPPPPPASPIPKVKNVSGSSSLGRAGAAGGGGGSSHNGLKAFGGLLGVSALGGGALYYIYLENDEAAKRALEDPSVAVEAPPAEFVHPYSDKPLWWRIYFAIKRAIYVAVVFLPAAGVGVVSTYIYPDSEKWRLRFLEALLRAMERAGCCFMKLGQWISMRPDMFPRDVVQAMARLREGVPAHPFSFTEKSIKESLGKEISEIFEFFDENAVASGTVAQVHRARLKPEYAIHGTIQDVAVKVRHPHILQETFLDMDLIFGFVENVFGNKYSMPCSQDELTHILRQQLDLKWEAYNLYKFSTNFRHELESGES